ncbi:hypothetical protein [Halorubrum tropicale]|uniref:Uncharacterized protein n=1 Tax=Halorubrum tropicale TaxID=1765655 RepID=A0A0M9AM19_9EURY|nr:hypothetical protein [Halorubrum tropicale]KOX94238.1 hypothetical protein AMR74_16160 [Halorubrum tropicale]
MSSTSPPGDSAGVQQVTLDEFAQDDNQCSAIAVDTEKRCQKRAVPGSEYCHLHLDLHEFARTR